MSKPFLLLCISLYSAFNLFGQSCERYDKTLFNMLPDDFPDEINCIDSAGVKQGWWIKYKVEYNPVEMPDNLTKGNFVGSFNYGKYKDGKRIGDWKTINNRHVIYEVENKNYYYSSDTVLITLTKASLNTKINYFNADSSIMIITEPPYTVEFNKNKYGNSICVLKHNNHIIHQMPAKYFDVAIDYADVHLKDKIKKLDEQ